MPTRHKILLSCCACSPYAGSEPGMGWNFAYYISLSHDVHVIVAEKEFKTELEKYTREHPEKTKNITFHYIARTHHNVLRKIWPPSFYWFYRKWHKESLEFARELDRIENFDIVHHITLSGFREPGYLWKLKKPFVWGPIGGLTDTPWCLLHGLGWHGGILFGVRNILNALQKRYWPAVRKCAANSSAILTSTNMAVSEIKAFWNRDAILMSEVGLETSHAQYRSPKHLQNEPLKICWAAEHTSRKALDLLLRALPSCKQKMELHVLSKGPRTDAWKKLAKKLNLTNVIFHGFIEREEVFRIMGSCHVFCITSVREDTSTVVFEAFRYGLPIIAMDHCGFSAVINDNCGIKIPIHSSKQVIADYAKHLDYLATHEEERLRLSQGAIERCKDYSWTSKMEVLNDLYESILQS